MSEKQYSVNMRVTVNRIVTCEGCTEDQARNNPFDYAVNEQDADMVDWEVMSVTEDE